MLCGCSFFQTSYDLQLGRHLFHARRVLVSCPRFDAQLSVLIFFSVFRQSGEDVEILSEALGTQEAGRIGQLINRSESETSLHGMLPYKRTRK
jgi:hypothetical protein